MKHIFIINPAAGAGDSYETLEKLLAEKWPGVDYALYATQAPGDATAYIKHYCIDHPEPVRFYACGGDGTLNEVINGVVGFAHASVGCYPCGSGNDFVKYYGGKKVFRNLETQLEAKEEWIDLLRVGNKYAVNVIDFGFDTAVLETMHRVRRKKLIGGKNAYTTGVVTALFKAMKSECSVTVDGECLNPSGKMMLCTVGNGQYVGGSFRCAPRSINNDGKLDVCFVRPLSYLNFFRLIGYYARGEHLDEPHFAKYLEYRRGERVEVTAPEGFLYSSDGELIRQNRFAVEIVPRAVRFAVPEGAVYLPNVEHVPIPAEEATHV